jgi:hypothetical protein
MVRGPSHNTQLPSEDAPYRAGLRGQLLCVARNGQTYKENVLK